MSIKFILRELHLSRENSFILWLIINCRKIISSRDLAIRQTVITPTGLHEDPATILPYNSLHIRTEKYVIINPRRMHEGYCSHSVCECVCVCVCVRVSVMTLAATYLFYTSIMRALHYMHDQRCFRIPEAHC